MLDIGWSELLVVAIVMIVVVGPKDLPKMLRAFGKATARMRATANEFRQQFNEALKDAELEDVKTIIDETRKLDPRSKITQVFDPIRNAGEDLRSGLQSTMSTPSAAPGKTAEATMPDDAGAPVAKSIPEQAAEPKKTVRRATSKTQGGATGEKGAAAPKKPAAAKPETAKTTKTRAAKAAAPAKKTTEKTGTKA